MSLAYIDPIAFQLGPITIFWYGIFIALSFLAGIGIATQEAKRKNVNPDLVLDLIVWTIPFVIIGARAYYVIFKWDYYSQYPAQIIDRGGLAIHGGLIAAITVTIIFTKRKKINFWKIADITAPGIVLGQAIGRWGNFMNQEAHGGPVSRSFLENLQLPTWLIEQMRIDGTYYHPTFLYESLWNLTVFCFLFFYWNKKDFLKPGELFLSYLGLYSLGRFFIEEMRTDSLMLGPFRVAQLISIFVIMFCFSISYYNHKNNS
ncbi:prolipoprotein diacylglyceryl transferase [Natroniella acetigena]|uniref:prolipoprotein diacylglyceryl transferase n=1 Tax=Natroniella acetigena TaxID=52004 RepID=UPI002009FB38|nr:prolipoprotein diacylglyceryl transferase [Natroniella acetigena]